MINKIMAKNDDIYKSDWDVATKLFDDGDLNGALFTFRRLACEGYPQAYAEIGNIFEQGGGGVTRDYLAAQKWYKMSIDKCEDPKSYLALGCMHYLGLGGEKNSHKSSFLFKNAAAAGEVGAYYILGRMYRLGDGLDANKKPAGSYLRSAIARGHILAEKEYGLLLMSQNHMAKGLKLYLLSIIHIFNALRKNPNDKMLRVR